jgi:hypothetical protein
MGVYFLPIVGFFLFPNGNLFVERAGSEKVTETRMTPTDLPYGALMTFIREFINYAWNEISFLTFSGL